MTDDTINPDDYPPLSDMSHGPWRLSWWDPERTKLAGIEVWSEHGDEFPQQYYVLTIKKPTPYASNGGARHGFRRRCGWCGVVLRGWQLNLCRVCKRAAGSIPLPGQGLGSPPFPHGSRWDDEPDRWKKDEQTLTG